MVERSKHSSQVPKSYKLQIDSLKQQIKSEKDRHKKDDSLQNGPADFQNLLIGRYATSRRFETVVIRHQLNCLKGINGTASTSEPPTCSQQLHLPLRVHQCLKVPFYNDIQAPFFVLQIYNHILCLNVVSMTLTRLAVIDGYDIQFPRIDLASIMFSPAPPY